MKIFKMGIILMVLLIIMLGVSGCMGKGSKEANNGKTVKEEMLEHMKNKYGEEFELVNIGTDSWVDPYSEMILHSKKFPKGRIIVRKGGDTITDNYTDFLMKEKIEAEMTEIVSKIYPKSKVLYDAGGKTLGNEVNPSMSVKEYSKSRLLPFSITVCISESNFETNKDKKIEELRKALEEKQYRSDISIFYVLEDKLSLINSDNINELYASSTQAKWSVARGDFLMDNSCKFISRRWSEIK